MKFQIKNRFTGAVQVTAEIECDDDASYYVKLGLAVRWAFKSGADLRGADLRDADLRGAYLRGADLRGADLRGAYLRGAYLRGAYLRDADLRGADLRGADLRGAYLRDADLRGADLRGADLRDADLRGAYLRGLILIARTTRADGYEYFAWTSILGGMVIKAGCREWVGDDAISQAREHCRTVTHTDNRAEALRIVDFIEAGARALKTDPVPAGQRAE